MPAGHAKSQVYPGGTSAQTIFTAVGARGYFSNLIKVCAGHVNLLIKIDLLVRNAHVTEAILTPFSLWEKGWGRGAELVRAAVKPSPQPSPRGRGKTPRYINARIH